MTRLILAFLLFFSGVSPALAQDKIHLPCEVLEVSPVLHTDSSSLRGIHYLVIHHANAADRQTLSRWLKARSGYEVKFVVAGHQYSGVLCRLSHCFGRGLLIYSSNVRFKPRDIIDVVLPLREDQ
jgi:hypothetical protein